MHFTVGIDLLPLPHWTVHASEQNTHDYRLTVSYQPPMHICPHCSAAGPHIHFGKREQLFLDLPIQAKRVGLLLQRQRYRCSGCARTFLEPLPDIDEHHMATKRLIDYVRQQALSTKRTFVSLAEEGGMSEGNIRHIFKAYLQELVVSPDCF